MRAMFQKQMSPPVSFSLVIVIIMHPFPFLYCCPAPLMVLPSFIIIVLPPLLPPYFSSFFIVLFFPSSLLLGLFFCIFVSSCLSAFSFLCCVYILLCFVLKVCHSLLLLFSSSLLLFFSSSFLLIRFIPCLSVHFVPVSLHSTLESREASPKSTAPSRIIIRTLLSASGKKQIVCSNPTIMNGMIGHHA